MADLYAALLHHPVYDKNGAVVTTAVTNMDVHDFGRFEDVAGNPERLRQPQRFDGDVQLEPGHQ